MINAFEEWTNKSLKTLLNTIDAAAINSPMLDALRCMPIAEWMGQWRSVKSGSHDTIVDNTRCIIAVRQEKAMNE